MSYLFFKNIALTDNLSCLTTTFGVEPDFAGFQGAYREEGKWCL